MTKKNKMMPKLESWNEPPAWIDGDEDFRWRMVIGMLLDDNARLQRAVVTKRMKKHSSTYTQWYALSQISRNDGMSQTEIGQLLEVTKGAGTTLIDRLIAGGWVERRQDTTDRRRQLIFLTPRGQKLMHDEVNVLANTYDEVMDSLSDDEQRILIEGLLKISKGWSRMLEKEIK